MRDLCLICGQFEDDHHHFSPPPPGCQCAEGSWEGCALVPRVCTAFSPEKVERGVPRCNKCQHDEDCHTPTTEGR